MWCSPFALTDDCVAEGAVRRLGIVYIGTEHASTAAGVVLEAQDSHAAILTNNGFMSPQ